MVKGDVVVGELAEDGNATISAGRLQFGGDGNSTTSWKASLKSVRIEGNLIARYNSSVSFNTGYDYDGTSYATVDEYAQYLLNTGAAPTVEVLGAAKPQGGDARNRISKSDPIFVKQNSLRCSGISEYSFHKWYKWSLGDAFKRCVLDNYYRFFIYSKTYKRFFQQLFKQQLDFRPL